MADTSWEYVIPSVGTYNDTSKDFEPVVPGVGAVNEGAAAPAGARPQGPLGHVFTGPFGGPI